MIGELHVPAVSHHPAIERFRLDGKRPTSEYVIDPARRDVCDLVARRSRLAQVEIAVVAALIASAKGKE